MRIDSSPAWRFSAAVFLSLAWFGAASADPSIIAAEESGIDAVAPLYPAAAGMPRGPVGRGLPASVLVMPDSISNTLVLFDPEDGSVLHQAWFSLGGGTPIHALQVGDEIWVSEQVGDRVSRWDLEGNFLGAIGGQVAGGGLDNVRGMGLVDDTVYVTNAGTENDAPGAAVVLFATDATPLGSFSTAGLAPSPFGVLAFEGGILVSSSTANDDVHHFELDGTSIGTFHNSVSLNFAEQMAYASNGDILVAGFSSNNIVRLDPADGSVISTFPASGARGIAQLGNGNLLWTNGSGAHVYDVGTGTSILVHAGGGRYVDVLVLSDEGDDVIFADGFECTSPGLPGCTEPVVLEEGFEDIATLVGDGWILQNNSQPLGTTGWMQGSTANMDAQAGSPDSFIAANFNNAGGAGTISNWLLSPLLTFDGASWVSFWTRASGSGNYPDRLEVRACSGATCSNVGSSATDTGDFDILLTTINPNLQVGDDPTGQNGYPYAAWAQFVLDSLDGLPTSGQGRVAFRYFVTNSGPDGSNGSYIGIDTVSIQAAAIDATPGFDQRGTSPAQGGDGRR